jgi:hypothetical protein
MTAFHFCQYDYRRAPKPGRQPVWGSRFLEHVLRQPARWALESRPFREKLGALSTNGFKAILTWFRQSGWEERLRGQFRVSEARQNRDDAKFVKTYCDENTHSTITLRYCDVVTGEFANIGVVLYAPAQHTWKPALRRPTKVERVFLKIDHHYRALMRYMAPVRGNRRRHPRQPARSAGDGWAK